MDEILNLIKSVSEGFLTYSFWNKPSPVAFAVVLKSA